MTRCFEPVGLHGLTLPNRFVRSATWEGMATDDGMVTPALTQLMVDLAEGGVGLVITGYAYVLPEGQSTPRQMAAYDNRFMAGWRDAVGAVHQAGGKIALQIVHGGVFADPGLTGREAVGPSAREGGDGPCREATPEELADIVAAFASAARRGRETGFDAVQLHAAHGFLLSQFLSPAFNTRTDAYGGSLENRARLLLETVRAVREAVGAEYPLLVKINSEDFMENGLTRQEAVEVCAMLEAASIDAIEYSGGTRFSVDGQTPVRKGAIKTPDKEAWYREAALLYKKRVGIPLLLVGGIRSIETAEALVEENVADFISLGRPLICEPGLVNRWRSGDRRQAECVSDNACFAPAIAGEGLYCATMAKKRAKAGEAAKPA